MVEAPRGTLFHHYETDERGLITQGQPDRGHPEQRGAHRDERREGGQGPDLAASKVSEGLLNMVEMAFRAYDPCLGCATHSLPGSMPLSVRVRGRDGETLSVLERDSDGSVRRS